MATICPLHRATRNTTAMPAAPATDREVELAAIFAAAELAFDQLYGARDELAA